MVINSIAPSHRNIFFASLNYRTIHSCKGFRNIANIDILKNKPLLVRLLQGCWMIYNTKIT